MGGDNLGENALSSRLSRYTLGSSASVMLLAGRVVPTRCHDRFAFMADSGTSTRLPSLIDAF